MPGPATVSEVDPPLRPRLRGVIHRYASITFAVGIVGLVIAAGDGAAKGWVIVYGLCVTTMLGVSAVYHSGRLSERAVRVFKRIDHSTILLAIAGSYTAIIGLGLAGSSRALLLAVVWSLAIAGVAIRMAWLDAPYPLVAVIYVGVGWAVLINPVAVVTELPVGVLLLVLLGGIFYSAGAAVYALHKPNPWPATFGYHEVFHTLVVLGVTCHFLAVVLLLANR
jgi:hemolysin III